MCVCILSSPQALLWLHTSLLLQAFFSSRLSSCQLKVNRIFRYHTVAPTTSCLSCIKGKSSLWKFTAVCLYYLRPHTRYFVMDTSSSNLWPAVRTREYESNQSMISPHARVMSPNDGFHEGILDEAQLRCQACDTVVTCLFVCIGCGIYGHAQCLRLAQFFEYLFCPTCLPQAAAECVISGRSTSGSMAQQFGIADNQVEIKGY